MQSQLVFPVPDEHGLLIVGHQTDPVSINQGMFFDIRRKRAVLSQFYERVGPINHWHNSYSTYKSFTCFITDQL